MEPNATPVRLEPLTVGQIVDRAFQVYRQRFLRLVATAAILYVPAGLVNLIGMTLMFGDLGLMQDAMFIGPPGAGMALGYGLVLLNGMVALIVFQLIHAAMSLIVGAAYLGDDIGVGEALWATIRRAISLIGASVVVAVLTLAGYLLLVVPGVICQLLFILVVPAIALEQCTARQGLERSRELARGNLGKIFGVSLAAILAITPITLLFQLPGQFVMQISQESTSFGLLAFNLLSSMVGSLLAAPIATTATVLLYYDLRIRKEGFDLEMMVQGTEPTHPPPAAPPPLPT